MIIPYLKEQNIFMHGGKEDQVLMSLNLEIIEIFLKDLKIIFYIDLNKITYFHT